MIFPGEPLMSVLLPSGVLPIQSSNPVPEARAMSSVSVPAGKTLSRSVTLWGSLIVAVSIGANAAMLIAQQVAIRLLSPLIGSSVETWSMIIGVFLLGIALGNRIAGKLTDRMPPAVVIVAGLLLGAVSIAGMASICDILNASTTFDGLSLALQIFTAACLVGLLPGISLSLVTPPSIKSVVTHSNESGFASGRIFAWGTFGSLAGNYLAGFVLLAWFGVRLIADITSVTLVVLAVITILGAWRSRTKQTPDPGNSRRCLPQRSTAMTDTVEESDTASREWYKYAMATVIACSFASGALEGAAFRILAPLVGVSMFLSAGVVGVVLAGMSLGNALGGRIAARCSSQAALGNSLAASAVATLAVAPFWKLALSNGLFAHVSLIPQILLWSFSLFFLPALALGTITPQVVQLSVRNVRDVGTISGQLYAWSTMGCIAGILTASWCLIETIGAVRTSILCGIVPLAVLWLVGKFGNSKEQTETRTLCKVMLLAAGLLLMVCKSPYDRESQYFSLAVQDDVIDNRDVKVLVLDRLVHSAIDLNDPGFLHYPHERVQGDLTRAAAREARINGRVPRILIIGGGGYSFPRWVEAQADLQDVEIDVVEIDPQVTEIAHDKLGLPRSTRIVSIHKDGRQFVKAARAASYDLVIQDAVNDFSVPYHLMTAEYNKLIQHLLQPDGVYLLTVIDSLDSGLFLSSAMRTMQSVFAETDLLAPQETVSIRSRSVFVIGGRGRTTEPGNQSPGETSAWWKERSTAHVFPRTEVEHLLLRKGNRSPLLTDDYAPVDTLMTAHFLQSHH